MSNKKNLTPAKSEESASPDADESKDNDVFIVLIDGSPVPKKLMDRVRKQVDMVLSALVPDARYTLKRMCGKEFWSQLTKGQKIAAGQCMAYMVFHKQLPLDFAEPTRGNSKRYKLK